ncbi:MAG: DsbA family protein, partial [Alphaproteobacteria bacterium]|nr:DsbA family protein [Alphaproteobacteria bacterium]
GAAGYFVLGRKPEKQTAVTEGGRTVDLTDLNAPPEIGEMTLGNADAKVTLIEYASASCSHCAAFHNDVFPTLKSEFIETGKIHFVFREFPHNEAAKAAFMLVRSLPKESYFPLMEVLYRNQQTWVANPHEGLLNIAKQAGLSEEKFNKILSDQELAKRILAVRDKAQTFGVTGIPTFFLNGEVLKGEQSIETLREKINALLG